MQSLWMIFAPAAFAAFSALVCAPGEWLQQGAGWPDVRTHARHAGKQLADIQRNRRKNQETLIRQECSPCLPDGNC